MIITVFISVQNMTSGAVKGLTVKGLTEEKLCNKLKTKCMEINSFHISL